MSSQYSYGGMVINVEKMNTIKTNVSNSWKDFFFKFACLKKQCHFVKAHLFSVNRVVEFPGAGLGRLITINSELNGAI